MWWHRVLWLHKANANSLTTDEKNALNILSAGEEFQLPSHIAQYLGNVGNFVQGGEQYFFRMLDVHLAPEPMDSTVKKGWFETTAANRVDHDSWWYYAQFPSPGVYTSYALNEANECFPNPGTPAGLGHIAPTPEGLTAHPTDNIIGWNNLIQQPHHSSWRATYSMLGWSGMALPADSQTSFNISTSTLKWVSERLSTLKDFKLHSSKQLTLSVQGSTLQTAFLVTEDPSSQMDQRPPVAEVATNNLNASRYSDLAVASRFSLDAKSLAPTFAFGYRIKRSKVFGSYSSTRDPTWHARSNYQPWLFVNSSNQYAAVANNWYDNMDEPFEYGSQRFMNVVRFSTHQLSRSVGLDAALILSDTR